MGDPWTVERVIADIDAFGDWLAVTPGDDPESVRIGKELAEAWQAELDSMSPAERAAWLAFLEGDDGDDDPGGGTPVELLPLPLAAAEPDVRGPPPPRDANRPPGTEDGRAALGGSTALPHQDDSPAGGGVQLRCAGCGAPGRPPTILWDRSAPQDPRPVRPVFGFYRKEPGRPALLCEACNDRWRKRPVLKPGRRP